MIATHTLKMDHCDLPDTAVKHLANHCSSLFCLHMRGCRLLTDEAVVYLANNRGAGFKELVFFNCPLVTVASLLAIANNCPRLETISTWNVDNVTDEIVTQLAEGCREVTYFHVSGCELVTDASLDKIGECCPKLTTLVVDNCPLLTQAAKTRLKQKILGLSIYE